MTMILLQALLLQFIAAYHDHTAALSAVHAQLKSRSLSHRIFNNTECPSVWYKFNQTTQDCQCIPLKALTCDGEHAYTDTNYILTYDSVNKRVLSSQSGENNMRYIKGYNLTKDGNHILLPDDVSELNHYMCGPLNRKHQICSECKSGYGPAVISERASCSNQCYICKDIWYKSLLYLLFQFIPVTVFCLLILVFQIRLTSAPVTCFIMYSQLVVLAFYKDCNSQSTYSSTLFRQIKFTDSGEILSVETKILFTLYGVFNHKPHGIVSAYR